MKKCFTSKPSLGTIVFLLLFSFTQFRLNAQVATYTGSGGTSTTISGATNTTVSALQKVGFGSGSACGSGGLSGMTGATAASYASGNPHIFFWIKPNSGYALNVSGVSCGMRESGTGATKARLAYSLDSGATWIAESADHALTTGANCGVTNASNTISWTGGLTVSHVQNSSRGIWVAIYMFAGASGGTNQVNSITVSGTVNALPVITTQPTSSITITAGSSTSFGVAATAVSSYRWQRGISGTYTDITSALDGGVYSTFATTTLNITSAPVTISGYTYRVILKNSTGDSVISNIGTLTVNPGSGCSSVAGGTGAASPSTLCGSGTSSLSISGGTSATGLTYQWYSSSTGGTGSYSPVSGATSAAFTSGTLSATTYYKCVTTCTASGNSDSSTTATVTVNALPSISVTPAGGDVCSGGSGLSMTASGASTYTWAPSTGLTATTGATRVANPTSNITYTITGTSAVGCVNTTTVTATYRLMPSNVTVSPSPLNMCPGAAPQLMTASGGIVGPTTVSSGTISGAISGAGTTNTAFTLNMNGIPTGATITSASVTLDASMPWQDDYVVNLKSPDGHVLNLINQKGIHAVSGGSFTATTVSSASTNPFVGGGATIPASTTFQADAASGVGASPYLANVTSWSGLYGTLNGTWALDFYQATTFSNPNPTINSWSITLNYSYQSITWSPVTNLYTNSTGTAAYTGGATNSVYVVPTTGASSTVYTVTGSDGTCATSTTDTVTVNAIPTLTGSFDISPLSVCPGSTVSLSFTGTASGPGDGTLVGYNWTGPGGYSSSSASVSSTFVPTTSAESGTYSVSVTYSNPGCTSAGLTSTSPLDIISATAYNVTGGVGCVTSGANIGLDNSDGSVNYQLYNGSTPIGSPVSGTGSALDFGTFTTAGTYKIMGDNGTCSQFMNDSVVIYNSITPYNVTGGGVAGAAGCTTSGLVLGLSGSQSGVTYQLYNGSSTVGAPMSGTGSALLFNSGAAITAAGTYTVSATLGSCSNAMTGNSIIYSSLSTYTLTGGNGCTSPGVAIGLTNSDAGATYKLYLNGVATTTTVTGTGSPVSFGTITTAGSYTAQATVGGACAANMYGTDRVYGSPTFTVTPASTAICASPGTTLSVTTGNLNILSESFDGTITNDGWSTDFTSIAWAQTTGSSYSWSTTTLNGTGKFYILNDGVSSLTSSHIISPSFSLAGFSAATLSFGSFFDVASGGETAGADISVNGGAWTSIFNATTNWSAAGTYSMVSQNISLNSYVGVNDTNIRIRFRYDKSTAGTSFVFAVDNVSITGTPTAASYAWSPSTGLSAATGTSVTAIPTVTTTYTVSVGGCTAGTAAVRKDPLPDAGAIAISTTNICTGAAMTLSETGTPSGPTGATMSSYSWTGPNSYISSASATSVSSRTITPSTTAASGVYSLTVTYNEPGCTSPAVTTSSVTVNTRPTISGVTSTYANMCIGIPDTLFAGTPIGTGGLSSYNWSGPGGYSTSGTDVTAIFTPTSTASTGVYTLTVTYPGTGCTSTGANTTVNINALPSAGTINATPSTYCIGTGTLSVMETGTVTGPSGSSLVSYNWSGPDGYTTTNTSPSVTLTPTSTAASGVYSLSVTYSYAGCTSAIVSAPSITVSQPPAVFNVTGGTDCSSSGGITPGVDNSETGVSYQLYNGSSAMGSPVSGTGSSIAFDLQTTSGIYTVIATNGVGCTTNMTGSATLNQTPGITPGANPSVCQPATSASISYTSAAGSPTTYSISWDGAATTAGFSDVSAASLGGSSIPITLPIGVTGAFSGSLTVSNSSCTSVPYSFTVTVYAHPTASITEAIAPCSGYATNVVFTGTSGATVAYNIDGGTTVNSVLTGGTYSLGTGALTSAHTFTLINAHNPACSQPIDTTISVTPIPMKWLGGASGHETEWNNSNNWSCGFVPGMNDNVTIPTGVTYLPVIAASSTFNTASLTIDSGLSIQINSGSTLHVKGDLTNNGSITGTGTLSLNNTSAQFIGGKGIVNNLDLNNSNGATINAASSVTVKNTLTITSGTLTTSDSLILGSDSTSSARITPIPSSGAAISGNVKLLHYIQGGRRAYRFVAHPFSSFIALNELGNYVDITGNGGAANGFTNTGSNSPSAFWYNTQIGNSSLSYDPGWLPFTATNTTDPANRFNQYQGVRLFVRGSKGEGLGYGSYAPSPVTIGMWGPVNQGDQIIHMTKGTGSNQDFNLLGNPYQSPVDLGTVAYNAKVSGNMVGAAFYLWNPYIGTVGAFQAVPVNTVSASPYYVQANVAFELRAGHNNDSLVFTESIKNPTASGVLLKAVPGSVSLTVYDASYHPWDMMTLNFNDGATNEEDNDFDAVKLQNPDFNFYSLTTDNKMLAIDSRPYTSSSTIPLGVRSNYGQEYIIKAENVTLPEGGSLYLHDMLLNQFVLLQQGSEYRFSITKDQVTQGDHRFELSMKPAEVAPAHTGLNVSVSPNPATDEVTINFTSAAAEKTTLRIVDLSGVCVYGKDFGAQQSGSTLLPLSNLSNGIYLIELTSGTNKVVRKLVKE